ncbi:MAG TPA: AI-2E family transporter [archaeon]|nr:AI-2E family transporter [archaeon]
MIINPHRKDDPLIFRPVFKLSMAAVSVVLIIFVLLWIPGLLSSVLISIILVFILAPAVDFFERHGIVRINAILIVLSLIVGVIIILSLLMSHAVVGEYQDLASRMDSYSEMFNLEINRYTAEFERRFGLEDLETGQKLINLGREKGKEALLSTGASFGTLMTWLAVVPLLLFFFLLDGHRIKKALIGFLPNRYFEMSLNIHQKITLIVGGFIRAKLIESLVVGICAWVGFIIVGFIFTPMNYAFFLAIVVGLFNIIPYLGPLIGAIPVIFVAIVQYILMPQFPEFSGNALVVSSWTPVLAIGGALIFSQVVDNIYLIPVLLGRSVNVHPLIVLLSVIIGAKMLGITGMLISIPMASILQTMVHEVSVGLKKLRH